MEKIDYFDRPEMSQSALKELKKSAAHYYAKYIAKTIEIEETPVMAFGSAVHSALLEPEQFFNRYAIAPMVDKRTKEGSAIYKSFLQTALNKIILRQDDKEKIFAIVEAVKKKKHYNLIKMGKVEHEIFWPDNNVECKAKLDCFIEPQERYKNGIIIDVKTTINASAIEFSKSIYNFGYYNQVAWYCSGIKKLYNTENYPIFIFIVIEKEPPFESKFFFADDTMLTCGLLENKYLLNIYKNCNGTGKWFGYDEKIEPISLPTWAVNQFINL